MRSEGNAPKYGEQSAGSSLTTMLQRTGRFLVKDFLAKNNVITPKHSPHAPDLAPADCYLFPPLKSALKGRWLFMLIKSLGMRQKR